MKKKLIISASTLLLISYFALYHYSDSYESCINYNLFTGDMGLDEHTGHHLSYPWVFVSKIDTRPQRVCIVSASRNINCRLVQFDPTYYKELIQKEGFRYYWWYNRFSFNSGQETYRGFTNLLVGYSYGVNRAHFVKVIQEIGDEE